MNEQERPIKLAFVGTSCVGKTTLLDYYRKRLRHKDSVAFVAEAAREHFARHNDIPIAERFTERVQTDVQDLQLANEMQANRSGVQLIFSDRSVVDAAAYVLGTGNKNGSERLLRKVDGWINTYNMLYLLDPHDIPYANDAIRREDKNERMELHQAFLELFQRESMPYQLLSGTKPERVGQVDLFIAKEGVIYE